MPMSQCHHQCWRYLPRSHNYHHLNMICKTLESSGISSSDTIINIEASWEQATQSISIQSAVKCGPLHLRSTVFLSANFWIEMLNVFSASAEDECFWLERDHSANSSPAHFVPLQQELFGAKWTKFVRFWDPSNCGSRSAWTNMFSRVYQWETGLQLWVMSSYQTLQLAEFMGF